MTYVAINLSQRVYLRKSKNTWYATTDGTSAYHHSAKRQIEDAVRIMGEHGISTEGWMVMSTKEAAKLLPRRKAVDILLYQENERNPKPNIVVSVNKDTKIESCTTPATEHSLEIIKKVKEIQELISDDYISSLSKKMSEADKRVADVYHQVEYTKFNACDGYKLAKKMQDALRIRRGIKNEMAVMNYIRTYGVSDLSRIEEIATKAWKPEVDVLI